MLIGFDTETYLITSTEKSPKVVVCSWSDGTRRWVTKPGDQDTFELVSRPDNVFVGTHISYDIVGMMRWHPETIPHWIRAVSENRVVDIALREQLLYLGTIGAKGYDASPSLADLALKYLSKDISAEKKDPAGWRLRYGTLDGVPFNQWPIEALDYVLDDADLPLQILRHLGGLQPTEDIQVRASVVLRAIGTYGFAIDQAKRSELRTGLEGKVADLQARIGHKGWTGKGSQKTMGAAVLAAWDRKQRRTMQAFAMETGVALDPAWGSAAIPTDLRTFAEGYFASQQSLPGAQYGTIDPIAWTKDLINRLPTVPMTTRGPSTAEETLELIANEDPDLMAYVDLKHRQKMLSTYIEPYADPTVHPSFVTLVATGRTGCRSPNSQNVPRKDKTRPEEAFRTMFVARPRRQLGTSDYSQLELCTLAATIRERFPNIACKLGEAIDANKDVHCITGSLVTGISYEQMIKNKKVEGSPEADARQASKIVNFGRGGGLGKNAMIGFAKNNYGVDMTTEQVNKLFKAFDKAWPEIVTYLRDNGRQVESSSNGRATGYTLTGRPKAECLYTELSNYPFQGLAADGAKAALWDVWSEAMLAWFYRQHPANTGYGSEYAGSPLHDSRLVNFVHDEIVGEHPAGDAGAQALKRQDALMVEAMHRTCKRLVTIRVESKLSDQWEH